MGAKGRDRVSWWEFSRGEIRAIVWLLPILAIFSWLIVEICRPRHNDAFTEYADLVNSSQIPRATPGETAVDSLFRFDPNTIEYHDLCRLGFSRNEALGIVKYRERGKVFEIPEDFASCYQVSEDMYIRLMPYIDIGEKYRLKKGLQKTLSRQSPVHTPAHTPSVKPFYLDTITVRGLCGVGFSERQAEVIIKYRDMKGGLRSVAELSECYVVSDEMISRLEPYIMFREAEQLAARTDRPTLVNLNTADSALLRSVSGIGEKTVARIMEYRDRLGGFVRKEQLAEVGGVTRQNYERICPQIFVDSCEIQKIDVNFATAKQMASHPYIKPETLRKLLKTRQLKGGWSTGRELIEDKILTPEEAEKLAPYLLFRMSEQ